MNIAELVKDFQQVAGDAVFDPELRLRLLHEELDDLSEAIKESNRVEQLDAICDAHYIAAGTANLIGEVYPYIQDKEGKLNITVAQIVEHLKKLPVDFVLSTAGMLNDLIFSCGFSIKTFRLAFQRVHESNMSKFCTSEDEARQTVEKYWADDVDAFWEKRGDRWVVLRNDRKILKSINYKPVYLEDLV